MKKILVAISLLTGTATTLPAQVKVINSAIKNSNIKAINEGVNGYSFNPNGNGTVRIKLVVHGIEGDNTKSKSTPLNTAMCLTKEEVSGEKIETDLKLANPTAAVGILPGAVVDVDELLRSGYFVYPKMKNLKPVTLSNTSNLANNASKTVQVNNSGSNDDRFRDARLALTSPDNFKGRPEDYMPNNWSENTVQTSTINEKTSINVGASAFYMGISAKDKFSFSSSRFHYMYLFNFEQVFFPIIANTISSPADLFTDNDPGKPNWYYIKQVNYGRRLYILIESESSLDKYDNSFSGGFNWGVVGASYNQENSGEKLLKTTNMRVYTEGGKPIYLSNPKKANALIDDYFSKPFSAQDIAPLSYSIQNLNGQPVSMVTTAFLNSNNCLDKQKIRIHLNSLECVKPDDGDEDEEVFGGVGIKLYNKQGKQVMFDGKTVIPDAGISMWTSYIKYGSEDGPIVLMAGQKKEFDPTKQNNYIDINIDNLDMKLEIIPNMTEDDAIANDVFNLDGSLKQTIRQMIIEGNMHPVFEFHHEKSVWKLYIDIIPQ